MISCDWTNKERKIHEVKIQIQQGNEIRQERIEEYVSFLHEHLGEFRDEKSSITACFEYLVSDGKGGHLVTAEVGGDLAGLTAILETHMSKFIPENFLVYIAVSPDFRGKGIGKKILDTAKAGIKGSIALHVEPENPARKLYEREGFTNKYLEMRYNP